jgi:hypothetical protein
MPNGAVVSAELGKCEKNTYNESIDFRKGHLMSNELDCDSFYSTANTPAMVISSFDQMK